MAGKKLPAMTWYTGDWLKDPAVRALSRATRSDWFDLLNYMHENDRSGEVTGTTDDLARMVGATPAEMRASLAELKTKKVADVTFRPKAQGAIVTVRNRRMYRAFLDRKSARVRKMRQRHGGVTGESHKCHGGVPQKSRPSSSSSSSSSDQRREKNVSEDTHAGRGPEPPRKLNRQQQRVNDVEHATFKSRGVEPPAPAAIAAWLALVDVADIEEIVDDLESSGRLSHLSGKDLSAYIFGCVRKRAAEHAAADRRAGAAS